jgi:hypothetical protein
MKIFGIEGSIEEFKELGTHTGIGVVLVIFLCFILWHYRDSIFKNIGSCFKKKPLYTKIKCRHCNKKKFTYTYKNISDILRPSSVCFVGFPINYCQAGNFFICEGCRQSVGVWKSDNTLDQYNITEHSQWLDLLHTHRVCLGGYDIDSQWIKQYDGLFLNNQNNPICFIQQYSTYEMESHLSYLIRKFENEDTQLNHDHW